MAVQQAKSKKSAKEPKEPAEIVIDFDSNWKFLIIKYFYQFIDFFLPDLYADLDTSRPPVFLDNELQTIWRSMKTGMKMTDKLVRVWLKNGEERLVLVHIEIQARFETLFSKRMFTMSYRILDKNQVHPVALAVFVDTPIPSAFNCYEHTLYGTKTSYEYNAYKIIDQIEEELLKREDNLFSLVVLANLRTIQTKTPNKSDKEKAAFNRLLFKKHLYNLVIERNFEPEVYYDLLHFIDYLMILPEQLSIEYDNFTIKTTKEMATGTMKLKPSPGIKRTADAMYFGAYGVDVAAERQAAKRQIQVEKRKAKDADVKAKDADMKAKDADMKAKDAQAKVVRLVLALRFDKTAEQIAAIADIDLNEVKAILDAQPVQNNG
jgi:hypothetical protein